MVTVLVWAGIGVGALLLLALVIWLSNAMLHSEEGASAGGVGTAFGNAFAVFDPGQGRARDELDSHEKQGAMLPSAKDEEPGLKVDLRGNRVTIRQPQQPKD